MPNLLDKTHFLASYWQKKPVLVPAAIGDGLPMLSPNELAWLATLPDVESRLVFTERGEDAPRYRLENGPFAESRLADLPDRDWTLLVQDIEKHLPDFRQHLNLVDFVPGWRIDDLMVSCAAPGGSVGPHLDNYDVFLCQGEGVRQWTIGRQGEHEVDTGSDSLTLLKTFAAEASYQAQHGDVLYLPPGIPHWGVAESLCTTYSIGCRAPTMCELHLGQERVLGKPLSPDLSGDEQVFYTDADLATAESSPGEIAAETFKRVRDQNLLDADLADVDIARVFGSVVTDPKAWLCPDPVNEQQVAEALCNSAGMSVHGMAHIAWTSITGTRLVFVNGFDREISGEQLSIVRDLACNRCLTMALLDALQSDSANRELLSWMALKGLFDLDHSKE